MKRVSILLLVCVLIAGLCASVNASPRVKNVIIMISDGCGYNQMDAASLYQYGSTGTQVYEEFPFRFAMTTYAGPLTNSPIMMGDTTTPWGSYDPETAWSSFNYLKMNPTDSASAATAMSTGVKTYNAALGKDAYGQPLVHCFQFAEMKGMSTGVVTSVEWSHATPAGFVAHNLSRNDYEGIANEMVHQSSTDVIIGAGHPWFTDSGTPKSSPNSYKYVGGVDTWNALDAGTAGGDCDGDGIADPWTLIESREAFQNLVSGRTPKRVLGTIQCYTTAQQNRSGDGYADPYVVPFNENIPTLTEMTMAAINVLDNNKKGFCLMVEGGAVDWAGHANQSGRVIEEQIDFNRSVEAVCDWVRRNSNWGETLLIVTGDHETGYLTGPGSDPDWMPLVNNGTGLLPGMEWHSGDHTNSLIPFFAKGSVGRFFKKSVTGIDPIRGRYIDNTSIGRIVIDILQ